MIIAYFYVFLSDGSASPCSFGASSATMLAVDATLSLFDCVVNPCGIFSILPFRNTDPMIVVSKTTTNVTVLINSLLVDCICNERAKAMAPLISPANQQILVYRLVIGNFF